MVCPSPPKFKGSLLWIFSELVTLEMTETDTGRFISTDGWTIIFPAGSILGKNEITRFCEPLTFVDPIMFKIKVEIKFTRIIFTICGLRCLLFPKTDESNPNTVQIEFGWKKKSTKTSPIIIIIVRGDCLGGWLSQGECCRTCEMHFV